MKIQILGTGCPKCARLAANAERAAAELGLDFELVKVADLGEITTFGVMTTPALAVDGEVRSEGGVPGVEQIKRMLCGRSA